VTDDGLLFETGAGAADSEWDGPGAAPTDDAALYLELDGWEGPLDLLLDLARRQKVDLRQISILALVDQYLVYIERAAALRLEVAADYLVMAAWLAYLKSRLLLPKPEKLKGDEAPAEEVAARLAFRLAKLDAMRKAAEGLRTRPQLGRDVFGRGDPQAIRIVPSGRIEGDLYSLMSAYIGQRTKETARRYTPAAPVAYPLEDARERLRRLLPELERWTPLAGVAPLGGADPGPSRASYVASTLSASLELVKDGALEARQLEAFADVFLRARTRDKAEAA
jgi:segregation and condensation protein A